MVVKRTRRTVKPKANALDTVLADFAQWADLSKNVKAMVTRKDKIRDSLMTYLSAHGEKDEKGSLLLTLPEEVGGFNVLKRERRVSSRFDEEATEVLLKEKGLWETCTETVTITQIDQDAVYVAYQEGKISEDEMDSLIQETVTYAFKPYKG